MKYYNCSPYRLVADTETIELTSVTRRDYDESDIKKDENMAMFIRQGYLKPYTGKEKVTEVKREDARYVHDDPRKDKKVIVDPKNKEISYIIADSDSSDAIHTSDPNMVIAHDQNNPSPDLIDEGLEANSLLRNGSEKIEDQLNKDHEDSSFDDEKDLADFEDDGPEVPDVDDFMAKDASTFIRGAGKAGAKVVGAKEIVGDGLSQAINDMNQEVAKSSDEGEAHMKATPRANDFMKQSYAAKKKIVAKETDKVFLKEVADTSTSANLQNIVKQRLVELG